jgi:hypothetical protein
VTEDAALKVGLELARKAVRKFAKKGLLVGMMDGRLQFATGGGRRRLEL